MKKTALPPATLYEAALQKEHARHAHRLAALKRMQARLRMLDAFVPALQAAGLHLVLDEINDWCGKELYVRTTYFTSPRETQKLLDVLLSQGMREVERRHYGATDTVIVGKGRLRVVVSVDLPRDLAPVPAAAETAESAEAAAFDTAASRGL